MTDEIQAAAERWKAGNYYRYSTGTSNPGNSRGYIDTQYYVDLDILAGAMCDRLDADKAAAAERARIQQNVIDRGVISAGLSDAEAIQETVYDHLAQWSMCATVVKATGEREHVSTFLNKLCDPLVADLRAALGIETKGGGA